MYRIFCVFLLCTCALQVQTAFIYCGSKGSNVNVTVTNCKETEHECILKRGTDATIGIKFAIDYEVTNVTAVVHGVVSGLPVPFAISHPYACDDPNSGLECPLQKRDELYAYTSTLSIDKIYPKISVKVKWELRDQNDDDIACVEIPAKIK